MNKNFREKTCKICGNSFTPKSPSEKCCCDECKAENIKLLAAEKEARQKQMKRQSKKVKTDWSEIHRICAEAGLSYGYAVARGII